MSVQHDPRPTRKAVYTLGCLLTLVTLSFGCASPEERGASLYSKHCVSCHGQDGHGDPRRTGLEPHLDLTSSELIVQGSRGAVYRAISSGFGTMPGFAHKMPHQNIDDLTTFVMRLSAE